MRPRFATAIAVALTAIGFAAHAQQITFPAPTFRGGNTDWQIVLNTQRDLSVYYAATVPEAVEPLRGRLQQDKAPYGRYVLNGTIGAEKAAVKVQIAPVQLGSTCKLNNGATRGALGPFTHAIQILPAQSRPPATKDHKAWPKLWYGCGNFAMD